MITSGRNARRGASSRGGLDGAATAMCAVLAGLVWLATMIAAEAQPCTADTQCYDFGRTRTVCSGNTLVTKQSRCIGHCRSVELSRTPCPGPCIADRCIGGPLGSAPANPPGGGGYVAAGACARICACNDKKLTYGLGFAQKATQCRQRTVDCVYGCTCDPEPRCLKRGEV